MKTKISKRAGDNAIVFQREKQTVVAQPLDNGGYTVFTKDNQFVCPSPLELLSIQLGYLCRRADFEIDNNYINEWINQQFVFCEKRYFDKLKHEKDTYSNTINQQKKDIRKALEQIDSLKGEILELQKQNADLQIEAKKISIKKVIQWLKR